MAWSKTEHYAFAKAILDTIQDVAPRLIYADYLEEQDDDRSKWAVVLREWDYKEVYDVEFFRSSLVFLREWDYNDVEVFRSPLVLLSHNNTLKFIHEILDGILTNSDYDSIVQDLEFVKMEHPSYDDDPLDWREKVGL